jgi:hypothetical protein
MLLGTFKRGKDRKKRKSRSLLDSSKPWVKGQKPFIGNKFKKSTYMTPVGGAIKVGIPVLGAGIVGASTGGMIGALGGMKTNPTTGIRSSSIKNTVGGAVIGGILAGGLMGKAVIDEHRRIPQSILYKSRKKKERYY